MSFLEKAKTATAEVSANLAHLPELHEVLDAIYPEDARAENPLLHVGHIYVGYLRIIKDLSSLEPEEIELIRRANTLSKERGISANSVSHGGADYFLEVLGPKRQMKLFGAVLASADVNSDTFKEAIIDLSSRMTKGHELSLSNALTQDGDPAADKAIWGHTKGLQPEAMVHFVMAHFLERTFTAHFSQDPDSRVKQLVSQKDTLLAAMGDVIKLRRAQGRANSRITSIWEAGREQGGLGWNKVVRQEIYSEVVAKSK